MSKELVRNQERVGLGRWTARLIGSTSVAAALLLPSTQALATETASFDHGITLEQKETAELGGNSPFYDEKSGLTRDTGMDSEACRDFEVCGTDLGQPFRLPDGSTAQLFGDTFKVAGPFLKGLASGADEYRAQVMLRTNITPLKGQPIIYDAAIGLEGKGAAPEFLGQWHILMNDGVSLPNGDIVVSYQHTIAIENPKDNTWYTDYAGLAVSHNGGKTFQITGPTWENNSDEDSPYQMWSMQYDNGYVYIVSDRAGRRPGPMMLFRVPWDKMQNQDAYAYWDGKDWGEETDAKPIMQGFFGEPSLRKLKDGTWAMSYADYTGYPKIVTQYVVDPKQGPEGTWSEPKIQLTANQLPNLYGGGMWPDSTKDNVILIVSTWQTSGTAENISDRTLVRYDVSHLVGKL
jgi:hypothetical protein